jgi:hypothetical protein
MSLTDNSRKKRGQTASTITEAERIVADQVSPNRRAEILEYLKLFGYKPDRTILQVHLVGFFNKRRTNVRAVEQREAAAKRYGGTTFVVVGRTHDPSIMDSVIEPKRKEMKRAPGTSAICGRARILRKEHPMKLFRLILLQFMSLIQQTGRICSPPKDSW